LAELGKLSLHAREVLSYFVASADVDASWVSRVSGLLPAAVDESVRCLHAEGFLEQCGTAFRIRHQLLRRAAKRALGSPSMTNAHAKIAAHLATDEPGRVRPRNSDSQPRGGRAGLPQAADSSDRAGLRAGDVITSVNGEALNADGARKAAEKLLEFMSAVEDGDELEIEYLRNGKSESVALVPKRVENHVFAYQFDTDDFAGPNIEMHVAPKVQGLRNGFAWTMHDDGFGEWSL